MNLLRLVRNRVLLMPLLLAVVAWSCFSARDSNSHGKKVAIALMCPDEARKLEMRSHPVERPMQHCEECLVPLVRAPLAAVPTPARIPPRA